MEHTYTTNCLHLADHMLINIVARKLEATIKKKLEKEVAVVTGGYSHLWVRERRRKTGVVTKGGFIGQVTWEARHSFREK